MTRFVIFAYSRTETVQRRLVLYGYTVVYALKK
nr:MAG TPA: hypothetical protein [Caudoviricetes sp.]